MIVWRGLPTREAEKMQHFVRDENIALYKKLIAESEHNPTRDEDRHKILLVLLAEEETKVKKPRNGSSLADA
jgi:hypothetical protein